MPYSTNRGTSLERLSLTRSDKPLALQKLTRYFNEKVRETGSESSISTFSLGLSTLDDALSWTEPDPISPEQENLTPSFVHSIETSQINQHCPKHTTKKNIPDSERALRSLQIRWNSGAGMVMEEE
jgi:hypothetical protein